MKTLLPERPFIRGYYVVVTINGHKLYCSPTLFDREDRAEFWRRRWQSRFPAHDVKLEEVTDGEMQR